MDDKVFNLLEKMYSEMNERFDSLTSEIKEVKNRLSKVEIVLENQTNPQIMLLSEGQQSINDKLDNLSDKVDRHDIKIQVIEGGKRA